MPHPLLAPTTTLLLLTAVAGCGEGDLGGASDGAPTADGVPTEATTLQPWLRAGSYLGWAAESAPHPSSGPHGAVRTFVSPMLDASLAGGAATHPPGAAAVKELYEGGVLSGWSVEVKLVDGSGGDTWYWYEVFSTAADARPAYQGVGHPTCTGCHDSGRDYVRVPYPLR